MTTKLINYMWEEFRVERDEVLELANEFTQTKGELDKTAARIDLLRQLIELEGATVELPSELGR
jgi:hypothetical protein